MICKILIQAGSITRQSIPMNYKSLLIVIISSFFFTGILSAQIFKVGNDTVTLKANTVFTADSIILIPGSDFSMSNISLTKNTSIQNTGNNPYISRVYQFSKNTNPFSGSIQIYYQDGIELNGIPENTLSLNIYNGNMWTALPVTTRDAVNNFIFTSGIAATPIREFTLAHEQQPLPLVWINFIAIKKDMSVQLIWNTAQQQNVILFNIQHSLNGVDWKNIGSQPGISSNSNNRYTYLHNDPVDGINYYRILQTDADGKYSYSDIRTVKFSDSDIPFFVMGNPVTNNILMLQVNISSPFTLYSDDGKQVWKGQLGTGLQYIDVSRFAKGTYLLKANNNSAKIMIQ